MTIDELTAVVPAPNSPTNVPAKLDWMAVEKKLGAELPSDYKTYVAAYGTGLMDAFVFVATPFSTSESFDLFSFVTRTCDTLRHLKDNEGQEGVPFDIYPETPGLLPWGGDENGNTLYWLTDGEPDQWPCLVGAGRDARWQRFDMPMTTFLARVLAGEVRCNIWPEDFPSPPEDLVFESY